MHIQWEDGIKEEDFLKRSMLNCLQFPWRNVIRLKNILD